MNDVLTVHGGTPLTGTIAVRGAKNLVSKAMVAALLGEEPSRLRDVPQIRDVAVVTGLLELHGVQVPTRRRAAGELRARPDATSSRRTSPTSTPTPAPAAIPILFCGPLLHRLGEAFIPDLGGCRIGDRPINYHLDVLRQFGADRRQAPRGHPPDRAEAAAGHEARAALPERRARPSRCCSRPSAPRA